MKKKLELDLDKELVLTDMNIYPEESKDPLLQADRRIILNNILNVIFRTSPNKDRNIKIINEFYNGKTKLELTEEFGMKERAVELVLKKVKGYEGIRANHVTDAERTKIMNLVREYLN